MIALILISVAVLTILSIICERRGHFLTSSITSVVILVVCVLLLRDIFNQMGIALGFL